jgi:hypothetical protein
MPRSMSLSGPNLLGSVLINSLHYGKGTLLRIVEAAILSSPTMESVILVSAGVVCTSNAFKAACPKTYILRIARARSKIANSTSQTTAYVKLMSGIAI